MGKSKVVYLAHNYFVTEFLETNEAYRNRHITDIEYEAIVIDYYNSNFGLMVIDWTFNEASFKITDESKFALFMLQYPHHIEKIVYE